MRRAGRTRTRRVRVVVVGEDEAFLNREQRGLIRELENALSNIPDFRTDQLVFVDLADWPDEVTLYFFLARPSRGLYADLSELAFTTVRSILSMHGFSLHRIYVAEEFENTISLALLFRR